LTPSSHRDLCVPTVAMAASHWPAGPAAASHWTRGGESALHIQSAAATSRTVTARAADQTGGPRTSLDSGASPTPLPPSPSPSSPRERAVRWAARIAGDSDPSKSAAEAGRLAREITAHDIRYYNDAAPRVSDAEYDDLRLRLEALEDVCPALRRSDSPTQRVGAPPSSSSSSSSSATAWATLPSVRHSVPMRSLQNAFNADEVELCTYSH